MADSPAPASLPSEESTENQGLSQIGRFQQTKVDAQRIGMLGFEWLTMCRAFTEFEIWYDMLIGTIISLLGLWGMVHFDLITAEDWRQHKFLWIVVMVAPYVIVLLGHAIWRLARAPAQVYADLQGKLEAVQREREALKNELRKRDEKHVLILLVSSMSREGEFVFHINPGEDAAQPEIDEWQNKVKLWQQRTASVLPPIGRNKFEQLTDIKSETFPGSHRDVWFRLSVIHRQLLNLTEIMEKPQTYLVTFD